MIGADGCSCSRSCSRSGSVSIRDSPASPPVVNILVHTYTIFLVNECGGGDLAKHDT